MSGKIISLFVASMAVVQAAGCAAESNDEPVMTAEAGLSTGIGLAAQYFDNVDLTAPVLSRTDATVNFDWGTGSPATSIQADTFSARWSGFVEPRYGEAYTFYTWSDDGVRLWVNGQLLVDNWTDHGPTENSGKITLEAGKRYSIKMEFYERGGGAVAQLRWSSARQAKEVIPTKQLYTTATDPAAFTIDGNLTETAWTSGTWTPIAKTIEGTVAGITADYKARWSATDLLVAVRVNDGAANLRNDSVDPWQDDAVEIYLDMNKNRSTTYGADDFEFIFGYGDTTVWEKNARITGARTASRSTATGYQMEIAIPWSLLGKSPSAGLAFGFDVGVTIDQNGGDRDAYLMWNGNASNWQNTSAFGDGTLASGSVVNVAAPVVGPKNLAIMADFWDSKWLSWNDGYNAFPITWQGQANCLRVSPNATFIASQKANGWTGENEINGMLCDTGADTCPRNNRTTRVPVRPGSKIVYGGWVWVTPSTVGAGYGGGFQMFMDVYGANGRIKELQGELGGDNVGRLNVPFGSTGWTYLEMHFTVADSYVADGALGVPAGTRVTPTGIIPILQLNNWDPVKGYSEKAVAYLRNTVLTVTP